MAVGLTGCAASATYSSPEALKDAYVEGGGNCDEPLEVDEDMLSEGAHGIVCADPITFLIVFDSEEAQDRYIARTGEVDDYRYGGERWIASSESSDLISKLGGSEVK